MSLFHYPAVVISYWIWMGLLGFAGLILISAAVYYYWLKWKVSRT